MDKLLTKYKDVELYTCETKRYYKSKKIKNLVFEFTTYLPLELNKKDYIRLYLNKDEMIKKNYPRDEIIAISLEKVIEKMKSLPFNYKGIVIDGKEREILFL